MRLTKRYKLLAEKDHCCIIEQRLSFISHKLHRFQQSPHVNKSIFILDHFHKQCYYNQMHLLFNEQKGTRFNRKQFSSLDKGLIRICSKKNQGTLFSAPLEGIAVRLRDLPCL